MDDLEFAVSQSEQRETIQRLHALVTLASNRDAELDRIVADTVNAVSTALDTAERRLTTLQRCCDQYRSLRQRLVKERQLRGIMRSQRLTRDQALQFAKLRVDTLADSVPTMSSERRAALRTALDNVSKPLPRNGFMMLRVLLTHVRNAIADVNDLV